MTIRISNDATRKAPRVTKLVLNRETLQDLTAGEAEAAQGGGVFRPRSQRGVCTQIKHGCPGPPRKTVTCPEICASHVCAA
jgi:hypothetical protein